MPSEYVFDRPVYEPGKFFGRQELLTHIEQKLVRGENYRALILRGWRKGGKTSLLRHLEYRFADNDSVVPVYFNLHGRTDHPIKNVMADLAETIYRQVKGSEPQRTTAPTENYLREILGRLQLSKNRKLLLLIDEFEAFALDNINDLGEDTAYSSFFKKLNNLLGTEEALRAVIAVGRQPEDWSVDYSREQFHHGGDPEFSQQHTLGPLTQESALDLIRLDQESGSMDYSELNISEIERGVLKLSGQWPFLVQAISHVIKPQNSSQFRLTDLEKQVHEILRFTENDLHDMWRGMTLPERLYLAFLAVESRSDIPVSVSKVGELWQRYPKRLHAISFNNAAIWLEQRGILQKTDQDEYLFTGELLRRYVKDEHKVRDVLLEIDEEGKAAHARFLHAQELERLRKLNDAIAELKGTLQENENHLQAQLLLGEILLRRQEPEEAVLHLKKAYDLYPQEAVEPLAQAYMQMARQHEQDNLELALEFASEALRIAPEGALIAQDSNASRQSYARRLGEQAWTGDQLELALEYFTIADDDEGLAKVKQEQAIQYDEAHIRRLMDGGDWENAESDLESLIEKNPEHSRSLRWRQDKITAQQARHFEQGRGHIERREWSEAQAVLTKVTELDPNYQKGNRTAADLLKEVWLQEQAEAFEKEKQWHDAALTYEFLTQLFPKHERLSDWRHDVDRCRQRYNWAQRFDHGIDYLLQDEWQKAITQFQGLPPEYEKDGIRALTLQQMASKENDAAQYWQQQAWVNAGQAYRELLSQYEPVQLKDGDVQARWRRNVTICQQESDLAKTIDAAERHLEKQAWEKVRENLKAWQESRQQFERETKQRTGVAGEERVTRFWQQMELEELAQSRERNEQWEDASRNYESLLHLFPNTPDAVRKRWEEGRNKNRTLFNYQKRYTFAQESLENGDWKQAQKWLSTFSDSGYGPGDQTVNDLRQRAQLEQEAEEAKIDENWETVRDAYGRLQDTFGQNPRRKYWDQEYDRSARLAGLAARFTRGEKALEARNLPSAREAFLLIVQEEAGFARYGLLASSYLEQVDLELQAKEYIDQADFSGAITVYEKLTDIIQHDKRDNYLADWQAGHAQAIDEHLKQQETRFRQATKVEDWPTAVAALEAYVEASETYRPASETPHHIWLDQMQIEQEAARLAADYNWLSARKKYDYLLDTYPQENEEFRARWRAKQETFQTQNEQQTGFQDGLRRIDRALRNKPVDKLMLKQAVGPLEGIPEPESYQNLIKADLLTRLTTDRAQWNYIWPILLVLIIGLISTATFFTGSEVRAKQENAANAETVTRIISEFNASKDQVTAVSENLATATKAINTLSTTVAQEAATIEGKNSAISTLTTDFSSRGTRIANQVATADQQTTILQTATQTIQEQVNVIATRDTKIQTYEGLLSQGRLITGTINSGSYIYDADLSIKHPPNDENQILTLQAGTVINILDYLDENGGYYEFEAQITRDGILTNESGYVFSDRVDITITPLVDE